jgi:predicted HTH transcriptional regulator
MQSSTEQTLYDFKVGLHPLVENSNDFNRDTFSKIIKTLTAMANTFPGGTGYCILGVADNKDTAERFSEIYGSSYRKYSSFFITGINLEAERHHGDIDKYFTKLTQMIKKEPLSQRDMDCISRNITTVNYFDKGIVILKIESGDTPSIYDGKYYVRHGSNVEEVKPENFGDLFKRFQK